MKVAVVGGGINGVMSAWALAKRGCVVHLYERNTLMSATSSASTKLLHGGLRYLEHGEVRLVRESLRERQWWMTQAPQLVRTIEITLPVYENSRRPRWKVRAGLMLYDLLAGKQKIGTWKWWNRSETLQRCLSLRPLGLTGAFVFPEIQMDDCSLGLWAADQARAAGVEIFEHTTVAQISTSGEVEFAGGRHSYDRVVNIAGPWARQLMDASNISSKYDLDLVRGSHLVLEGTPEQPFMLEHPRDARPCFILPYHGRTLVGTTEVRQAISDPVQCSDQEGSYLLELYEHYLLSQRPKILDTFAGVRPLVHSHSQANKASREYALERDGKLVTAFGGKWTTARALGAKVADLALR